MPVTIADTPLAALTPELRCRINALIPYDRVRTLVSRSWPGPGNVFLANPTGYRPWPPEPFQVNRFYWPNGASRYAFGAWLASSDQAAAIHDAAFGQGGTENNTVTLSLSGEYPDGSIGETVSAEVYCLPFIPLFRVIDPGTGGSDRGAFLIPVVDDRFWWWATATPDFGISDSAGVSWADVFTAIGGELDLTITTDTIDAAYLQPSRALNLTGEPIPPVLDSALHSVGHRLVVGYDGTVKTQAADTAQAAWEADQSSEAGMARVMRGAGLGF